MAAKYIVDGKVYESTEDESKKVIVAGLIIEEVSTAGPPAGAGPSTGALFFGGGP